MDGEYPWKHESKFTCSYDESYRMKAAEINMLEAYCGKLSRQHRFEGVHTANLAQLRVNKAIQSSLTFWWKASSLGNSVVQEKIHGAYLHGLSTHRNCEVAYGVGGDEY